MGVKRTCRCFCCAGRHLGNLGVCFLGVGIPFQVGLKGDQREEPDFLGSPRGFLGEPAALTPVWTQTVPI